MQEDSGSELYHHTNQNHLTELNLTIIIMTTAAEECPEENYIEHPLQHVQQRYSWDCGVSCVLMLLTSAQRSHFLQNFEEICQQEGFGKSTWTIDLCYLLKRYNIEHVMYTTMPGVNENYKKYSYYEEIMDMSYMRLKTAKTRNRKSYDRSRVAARFVASPAAGIRIERGALSLETLRAHLRLGPAILLVDGPLLVCKRCKHNKMRHEIRRMFGGSYRGHYVLVVGYRGSRWLYRDPAVSPRVCETAGKGLMAAHRASGTDCDAVLVYTEGGTLGRVGEPA